MLRWKYSSKFSSENLMSSTSKPQLAFLAEIDRTILKFIWNHIRSRGGPLTQILKNRTKNLHFPTSKCTSQLQQPKTMGPA